MMHSNSSDGRTTEVELPVPASRRVLEDMVMVFGEEKRQLLIHLLAKEGRTLSYSTFNMLMSAGTDFDMSPYLPKGFDAVEVEFTVDEPLPIGADVRIPAVIIDLTGKLVYIYSSNIFKYEGPMLALMCKRLLHLGLRKALEIQVGSELDRWLIEDLNHLMLGRMFQDKTEAVFVSAHSCRVGAVFPRGLALKSFKNEYAKESLGQCYLNRGIAVRVTYNGKTFDGLITHNLGVGQNPSRGMNLNHVVADKLDFIKQIEKRIHDHLLKTVVVPPRLVELDVSPSDLFEFSIDLAD